MTLLTGEDYDHPLVACFLPYKLPVLFDQARDDNWITVQELLLCLNCRFGLRCLSLTFGLVVEAGDSLLAY